MLHPTDKLNLGLKFFLLVFKPFLGLIQIFLLLVHQAPLSRFLFVLFFHTFQGGCLRVDNRIQLLYLPQGCVVDSSQILKKIGCCSAQSFRAAVVEGFCLYFLNQRFPLIIGVEIVCIVSGVNDALCL